MSDDRDGNKLYRHAAGPGPAAAHAYTVGRHIVFAPGRFDPGSPQGRRLLAHELTHAAGHPPGVPTPSGDLRISTPAEAAERHAVSMSEGLLAPAVAPAAPPGLFRQSGVSVLLTGFEVNHERVTVPPVAGLSLRATKIPANASAVTLSVVGDNATIAAGTTVDNTTGKITVAAGQTGGSAHVDANQNATGSHFSRPLYFTAIPSGITSTTKSPLPTGKIHGVDSYGGQFTHTFNSPAGGQAALEKSHVNEQFKGASGPTLTIKGPLVDPRGISITINPPDLASEGWDLDSSGTMTDPDNVTWTKAVDARPFVANASHPNASPAPLLPLTQNFRNLTFPTKTFGAAAVAFTTHGRAIEDSENGLVAVTSAGINAKIVEPYVGPTVFRRCRAHPAVVIVANLLPGAPVVLPPGASTITVDAEGKPAPPTFSIRPPDLGCKITSGGVLTAGTAAGQVTVRAGDNANFDETTVSLVSLQNFILRSLQGSKSPPGGIRVPPKNP